MTYKIRYIDRILKSLTGLCKRNCIFVWKISARSFFLVSLVFTSGIAMAQNGQPELTGKWTGVESGDSLAFIFDPDGVITMLNSGDKETVIGGRAAVRRGKQIRMIYQTDLSRKPFTIDFIIQEVATGNEQGRMEGIFEFLNERQIKLNIAPGKKRPTSFEDFFLVLTKED